MVLKAMGSPSTRVINLLLGHPSPALLPAEHLSSASCRVLGDPTTSTRALSYGADEGYWPLRVSLAGWLNDFYSDARRSYALQQQRISVETGDHATVEAAASRITITGGASQSMAVILSTFTDPEYTQTVWMAVPAYYLAFKIFQDAGFTGRLRPIPEDEEGVNVEFLRHELERASSGRSTREGPWRGHKPASIYEKVYRHVVYVVPTFANPSSRTMSLRRREELVRVAREYDALVVCDDVYDMLQWPRGDKRDIDTNKAQLPRLVDVDRYLPRAPDQNAFGNVVSNGSFSKILGPGIRTGWVEAAPKFAFRLSQTGGQKSGGAPSQFAAVCVNEMLEQRQLQEHVRCRLRPSYERRWRLMRDAVRRHLEPLGVSVVEQAPSEGSEGLAGGYFVWLTLPRPTLSHAVVQQAKQADLIISSGQSFQIPELPEPETRALHHDAEKGNSQLPLAHLQHPPTLFPRNLRLCFAWEDEDFLVEGVERLAAVIACLQVDSDRAGTSS